MLMFLVLVTLATVQGDPAELYASGVEHYNAGEYEKRSSYSPELAPSNRASPTIATTSASRT